MKISINAIKVLVLLLSLLSSTTSPAQSLTGTWEGQMTDGVYFQLNIIQNGDRLCGHSYDYVRSNPESYCKEYFTATFNRKKKKWELVSTSFIENAPNCACKHLPMHLELVASSHRGKQTFKGTLANKNIFGSVFGFLSQDGVYLEKKSDKPGSILPGMKDCFEALSAGERAKLEKLKKDYAGDNDLNAKRSLKKSAESSTGTIISEDKSVDAPEDAGSRMKKRRSESAGEFEVSGRSVTIMVYDNGIVDDDSVSLFDNGRLLLSHQRLSVKSINIDIDISDRQIHEIILFAENLGKIIPNTAYIVIINGDKRYELSASADLGKNASIKLKPAR